MHKSGFINIIGNPNVGKSTLINKLVGEQLSIITSKVQTTRHRILGIVNGDNFQLVFSDTPGIIKPAYSLQKSMMDFVKEAIEDADIILYVLEMGEKINIEKKLHQKFTDGTVPVIILINKIDLSTQNEVEKFNSNIEVYFYDNYLHINSELNFINIDIYNMSGKLLKESSLDLIYFGNLPKGLYILKLEDNNGNFYFRKITF